MRILCCLDGTNSEQISQVVSSLLTADERTIRLLYVIDSIPHEEMGRKREGLFRSRNPGGMLSERMRQAEATTAQEILQEGLRYIPNAETLLREGRAEREIIQSAAEWNADLIVIFPRSPKYGGPLVGPKSVGHVARFVLDHAPCPVLLVRPNVAKPGHQT